MIVLFNLSLRFFPNPSNHVTVCSSPRDHVIEHPFEIQLPRDYLLVPLPLQDALVDTINSLHNGSTFWVFESPKA